MTLRERQHYFRNVFLAEIGKAAVPQDGSLTYANYRITRQPESARIDKTATVLGGFGVEQFFSVCYPTDGRKDSAGKPATELVEWPQTLIDHYNQAARWLQQDGPKPAIPPPGSMVKGAAGLAQAVLAPAPTASPALAAERGGRKR